ncbi:ABC transporter substrate-binding protein [Allosalinactinospora lopnorensis]|uniref:ABC transporter substrate-binding protein n=1 Tax=Allosalinactinospora lopnorensis TaxID=1352348 RepID=UPI000623F0C0|nr:extracellular solute-binding protein [Allosalinactinospora lopnorensis]
MRSESPNTPRVGRRSRRRSLRPAAPVAVLAALTMAVSGCGGGGSDDGTVQLRFSWWGADERHAVTQEVIERFEAKHPDIAIQPDYTDWDSYWDRLATSSAAGDAPDIIQHDQQYLRDYAGRNALLDLSEYGDQLDLSEIDELVLPTGELEGGQFAVPSGVNAFALVADPEAFEEAGVDMPDDETWTWDDYVDTTIEISEGTDGEVVGAQNYGFNTASFEIFARQHGESLYTEDGTVGYSDSTLAEWWEYSAEAREGGGEHSAAESIEINAGGPDQSVVATNSGAMAGFWSNQVGDLSETADRGLELLRWPGESENEQPGTFFKPAMYYTISSDTDHPEEAATFVDFLVNDSEAAELILADRGLPANLTLRDEIKDELSEGDAKGAEFLEEIADDVQPADPAPPQGAGEVVDIVKRVNEDVLHGSITPEEAAETFTEEVKATIGG